MRVRLPLARATVAGDGAEDLAPLADLLADEINVKSVVLTDDLEAHASLVLRPDGSVLGPRLGGDVQAVFRAARSGDWTRNDDGTVTVAGHTLEAGDFELAVEASEGGAAAGLASGDAVVVLDTEGPLSWRPRWARDAVRVIQDCRRTDSYVVTDRIQVSLALSSAEQAAGGGAVARLRGRAGAGHRPGGSSTPGRRPSRGVDGDEPRAGSRARR